VKIIDEIKSEWKQYKGQIICTFLLLVVGLLLGFLEEWGIGFGLLTGVLIYDIYLMRLKENTITKWSRRQLPGWADKILMVALSILIIKYGSCGDGWGASYWFIMGTINGHINWEK
jgi:hypothetical protein